MEGGSQAMNTLVVQAIKGACACMNLPAVQAAACGEFDALALDSIDSTAKGLALLGASAAGYLPVVRALLAAGAPLEATVPTGHAGLPGSTALHLAVDGGHTDAVTMLLDAGADIDSVGARCEVITMGTSGNTGDGQSPLIRAVLTGDVGMAALLLARGADPNLLLAEWTESVGGSHSRVTPLMLALEQVRRFPLHAKRPLLVQRLRDAGAV